MWACMLRAVWSASGHAATLAPLPSMRACGRWCQHPCAPNGQLPALKLDQLLQDSLLKGARCWAPSPPQSLDLLLGSWPTAPCRSSACLAPAPLLQGLHEAILRGALRYGPVSRYANPAALGGAAGWLFLNSPQDIQYVNATNTRNFAERCEPWASPPPLLRAAAPPCASVPCRGPAPARVKAAGGAPPPGETCSASQERSGERIWHVCSSGSNAEACLVPRSPPMPPPPPTLAAPTPGPPTRQSCPTFTSG